MSLLVAENVTRSFGTLDVLKNVSFRLDADARVGLVGANGQGKTTLLRLLAGEDEPTEGTLQRRGGLRIGYLPQDPPAPAATTVHEAMLAVFDDLRRLEADLHALAERMGDSPRLLEQYGRMQHRFDSGGGYGYETKVKTVLTGLGFAKELWDRPLARLSGGERTRAYLARLLLQEPELLLLDEPTNHLDMEAAEWLERWVQSFKGAMVVVSHDRYFLDAATAATWEVAFSALEAYRGSYTAYLKKRRERFEERMRQWRSQQEYIETTEEFIRRHLAGQRTKEAQGRRTRLERFLRTEAIPKPREPEEIHLRLRPVRRTGDLVLRAADLAVGYEGHAPLVSAEQLEVRRGQRIAIVGLNGTGKTTLLRTLLGQLPPLGGTVTYGANVTPGYLSQTQESLQAGATALEALQAAVGGQLNTGQARTLLGSFRFTGDDSLKRIDQLSGGQRTRVVLAQLAARNANFLCLDEPTNHLDIPSTEIFQEVLATFPETVLLVSHDRYLVRAVATHVWVVHQGRVKVLIGGWDEYVRWRGAEAETQSAAPGSDGETRDEGDYRRRRRESNRLQRQQRRHDELEEEIHTLEARLAELSEGISAAGEAGDVEQVQRLGDDYQGVQDHLTAALAEWERIGEGLESP